MKLCKLVKAPLNLALRKTDLVKSFAVRVILRSKEKGKLSRIYLKIYMKSLCYVEIYRANLDETNADMVQFTKRWNKKWIV